MIKIRNEESPEKDVDRCGGSLRRRLFCFVENPMNRASQYRSSLKLQIKVDDKTGSNLRCLLKTFGCGSAMASSSVTIKWVKVKAIKEILTIMNTSFVQGLPRRPETHYHHLLFNRFCNHYKWNKQGRFVCG
ncbi:uncharacterized protein LOC108856203 [Raphanus sativus]|uniref:Uncharacterized protein LOC108856203 n=1 Tax=Raphanus sativus TaxID=3726 RepID=A0A6J0NL31_RAPSA|nr:uncharacterized protein LOC108856203 [Raphanus sativus]